MSPIEQQLLARYAAEHDADAFRQIFLLHKNMVYATCRRILGNRADAEDVTQACFLNLARDPSQVRTSLAGWLHRTAVGKSVDLLRKDRARRERESRTTSRAKDSDESSWNEVSELIDTAVDELPETLRIPLIRYYLEERTQEDISSELNISQPTVARRLQRGVRTLRAKLRKAGWAGSAALLASLLATRPIEAAPATLTATLGKIAMAGVGGSTTMATGTAGGTATAAAATATAATGGIGIMKLSLIGIATAAAITIGVVTQVGGQENPTPQTAPPAVAKEQPVKEPAEISETVTYKGIVTDMDGKPISGATVRSHLKMFRNDDGSGEDEMKTRTDDGGRFSLGPLPKLHKRKTSRTLLFEHNAYGIQWHDPLFPSDSWSVHAPDKLRIRLGASSFVSGVVRDTNGTPIENASVSGFLWSQGHRASLDLRKGSGVSATTDAQGRFRIDRMSVGSSIQLLATQPDHMSANGTLSHGYSVPAGEDDVIIEMTRGLGKIEGRLMQNGAPFRQAGIKVWARGENEWQSAMTTEDGSFRITGLVEGTYRVGIDRGALHRLNLIAKPATIEVNADNQPEAGGADIELVEGCLVRGTLRDETTGKPIGERSIQIRLRNAEDSDRQGAYAYEDGVFESRLLPGEYTFTTDSWEDGWRRKAHKTISIEPGRKSLEIEWAIGPPPMIKGKLTDADGRPIHGLIRMIGGLRETAADGVFRAPWTLEGPRTDRTLPGAATDAELKLGRSFAFNYKNVGEPLVIPLKPMAVIKGRFVDPRGRPVSDAELTLMLQTGQQGSGFSPAPWETRIDADGEFTIGPVPTGLPVSLWARKGQHQLASTGPLDLTPGETRDLGEIVTENLPEDKTRDWSTSISGRVVDEEGKPVASARLQLYLAGHDFQAYYHTDSKGQFNIPKLPRHARARIAVHHHKWGMRDLGELDTGTEGLHDLECQFLPPAYHLYGKPAPALEVANWFNTEPLDLDELKGKVVALQMGIDIAHYNPSSALDASKRYGEKSVVVIAINRARRPRGKNDDQETLKAKLEELKISFPFALDAVQKGSPNGATHTAYGYDTMGSSAFLLIDKKGNLRRAVTHKDLDTWIEKLLAE